MLQSLRERWNRAKLAVMRKWNLFRGKSVLGKVWSVLVTFCLLWLGWTLLKLAWERVVKPYVYLPVQDLVLDLLGYKPAQ